MSANKCNSQKKNYVGCYDEKFVSEMYYFFGIIFANFSGSCRNAFTLKFNLLLKMGEGVICFFCLACTPIIDPNYTCLDQQMHQLLLGQVPLLSL